VTLAAIAMLAGRRGRCLLVAAVAVGAMGVSAASALGAPMWEITMKHKNYYGAQEYSFEGTVTSGSDEITHVLPYERIGGVGSETSPLNPLLQLVHGAVPIPGIELRSATGIPAKTTITKVVLAETSQGQVVTMSNPASATGKIVITAITAGAFDPLTETETGPEKAETFARESAFNTYTITVKNTGTESSGAVTVEDTLPEGMLLGGTLSGPPAFISVGRAWTAPAGSCEVSHGEEEGARVVKCSTTKALAPGESYDPIRLHVDVTRKAAIPSTTNVATVSGGGAAASASTGVEGKTTITPAVPFGIDTFATSLATSVNGEEGELPGGHPSGQLTEILDNYTTSEENGSLVAAGGGPKELQVEAPPGFLGNVQTLPRCPLGLLRGANGSRCPENTAVGYTNASFSGSIRGGKPEVEGTNALVYNMAPAPGFPAELGFTVHGGIPFLLETKLRSDGDYGVTAGDSAVGEKLLGAKTTLCDNGVGGVPGSFFCKAPAPSSKPFLTNPTECAAAKWGMYVNPWEEESDYVSSHTSTPAPSGCPPLPFAPQIGFEPSLASEGGSTEADEPTGMTFNLNLPQAGESAPGATAGRTLTCEQGSWENSPTGHSYEWLHNGAAISGATSETYTLKEADQGMAVQCEVKASNAGGGAAALSRPVVVSPVPTTAAPVPPALIVAPTGSAFAAGELTCVPGTWTGATTPLTYQWLRNGEAIVGATGIKYKVQPKTPAEGGDVPSALQCDITGTNGGGAVSAVSASILTTPKPAPTPPTPAPNSSPQISGQAAAPATPELKQLDMTLPAGMTVSPSAAHGLQACSDAQFGLGTEFGPGQEEQKKHSEELTKHFVPETPAKAASCPEASQVGTVEVFTPLLSGAPTAEGVLESGLGLECSRGTWSGGPALSYQWFRNGVPIANATGEKYAATSADEAKAIQCQVTATNEGGSSAAVSRPAVQGENAASIAHSEPIPPPLPPSSIAAPSGDASPGSTLTCAGGVWTGSPSLSYRWLRGGALIAGAEAEAYPLTAADQGKVIQCQVTGTNAGSSVIADSAGVIVSPVPSPTPPLPGAALQGQLFVGEPECGNANHPEQPTCTNEDAKDGKLFRLFIQLQDESAGLVVKLHGSTRVANTETGQLESVFEDQPQQPFELLTLKLKGGPTAPLANPQSCGPATTAADFTPWSTPSTPDATPTSSFNVEGCPATMPFSPSFNAGTTGPNATAAGMSTSFSLTFSRQDREQDLSGVQVHMPLGLTGKIAGIPLCGEAQANAGTCGPQSEIGTATSLAGPGPDPFPETGRVYLTGPYKGAPFGLSVVTPAVAGPFNLGNVIVRSAISINPYTAAVTVTSDPLPQFLDGVQLRLREVSVNVDRSGFMFNPTSCSAQRVSTTLSALQGASAQVSSPFGLGGCTSLPFKPTFTASTQAHTSKTEGASLDVKVSYPPGTYANIAKTLTELPTALPSRLTTLQKACLSAVFEANPAACPEGSVVGYATAHTPLLNVPLNGPAYLISHGGAAFPDLEIVLQGEGVEVILDGQTDIVKGVTKTTFNALPDSPVSTFELNLPEGPHSALGANVNVCTTPLNLPTTLTGQNGAVIKQTTHVAVTGCPPTVSITKTKLSGNALLVTVKTSAKGTVKISGPGLKTVKKNLTAGTHQIRVALTKAGRSKRKHRKKTSVHISLTVGKQAVAKATTVRL